LKKLILLSLFLAGVFWLALWLANHPDLFPQTWTLGYGRYVMLK